MGIAATSPLGPSIQAGELENSSVTTAKIAAGAIATYHFGISSVDEVALGVDAVTRDKIGDSEIITSKFDTGAVDEVALGTDAVTNTKIQDSAVTNTKIAVGTIAGERLADSAVTAAKIVLSTITNSQIAVSTISTERLIANAITQWGQKSSSQTLTVTATSWTNDLTDSVALTTGANPVLVIGTAKGSHNTAGSVLIWRITRDGVALQSTAGKAMEASTGADEFALACCWMETVTAGAHTWIPQVAVEGNTGYVAERTITVIEFKK